MLDLDELPAQLLLDPRHRLGGRGCTGHDDPDLVATGDLTLPVGCGFQDGGDHGRGGAHHGDSVLHDRSEEHTSELQSLMRISYAGFCLTKTKQLNNNSTAT